MDQPNRDETDGRRRRYAHRRGELLRAVTTHALEQGIADLTLRRAAQQVGVSHATLVHHFSTRDQLIAEIVDDVLTRVLMPSSAGIAAGFDLHSAWAWLCSREGMQATRLYLAITGLALYGDPPFAQALRRSQRARIDELAAGLVHLGCPAAQSEAVATNLLARMRGLAADLLLTGDRRRLDAAFEDLLRDAALRAREWDAAADGSRLDAAATTG
jgi:AcrR family transcriptional regulator